MNGKISGIKGRDGFATITAMSIVLMIAVMTAGTYVVAQNQMQAAKKAREFLKAKVIAEAGANIRYAAMKHAFSGFGTDEAIAFGDGTYQTTVTAIGDDRALLTSVGRNGLSEAKVNISLRNFGKTNTTEGVATQHPILQNAITTLGTLTLNGTLRINGDIASASAIVIKGGSGTIIGEANAPSFDGKEKVLSEGVGNDPVAYTFDWDTFLKIEDYINAPDTVVWNGSTPLSSYPAGTIIYYDGDINVNSTPVNCCLIATGGIRVQSHVTLNKPGNLPTLVAINGDIEMHGGPNVNGLIVAMGGTMSRASGGGGTDCNITGAIVTKGALDFGGGFVLNWDGSLALAPPGTTVVEDNTVVVAWQ